MKLIISNALSKALLLAVFFFLTSCGADEKQWDSFGEAIVSDGAVPIAMVLTKLDTTNTEIKVVAKIEDVCQAKGCWMTLRDENGGSIRVTFKDYGFFVPKDASGKSVIISGLANVSELDEDIAKHYADDAGEEFNPSASRREVSIVASGVLIEQVNQL